MASTTPMQQSSNRVSPVQVQKVTRISDSMLGPSTYVTSYWWASSWFSLANVKLELLGLISSSRRENFLFLKRYHFMKVDIVSGGLPIKKLHFKPNLGQSYRTMVNYHDSMHIIGLAVAISVAFHSRRVKPWLTDYTHLP
ncbi:hypothetical protein VNO77_08556 [Canavalia gladiata]|uniref:Uncharacterized protein n=1 Tax=Canavalia gladiata TaxID=3824 RepID=A0AAN9MF77_CANGL